jgi:osmotically-inducible protein OsmY
MPGILPRRETKTPFQSDLAFRVQSILQQSHPAFGGVSVWEHEGAVILSGQLPTYYLKQVVQTVAAAVEGVERLDNRVSVVRGSGPRQ